MYKIGIIGHSPEHMLDRDKTQLLVSNAIELVHFQYNNGNEAVIFNIPGDIGVGIWAAEKCIKENINYHLYITSLPDYMEEYLFDYQYTALSNIFESAKKTTIHDPFNFTYDGKIKSYHDIVNDSDFVLCFWEGRGSGATFDAMIYGLTKNKIVLDAMDKMKLITDEYIKLK